MHVLHECPLSSAFPALARGSFYAMKILKLIAFMILTEERKRK
jgi:hypothetical protein